MADQPIPLDEQIAEVKRELALRDRVYPQMIATGRMTEEEAAGHKGRMQATLNTLLWLQKNEAAIRAAARKRGA